MANHSVGFVGDTSAQCIYPPAKELGVRHAYNGRNKTGVCISGQMNCEVVKKGGKVFG